MADRGLQTIPSFLGVNLRRDRLSLEDGEVARAINADLHTLIGTARLRFGRTTLFSTALTQLAIRRLFKRSGSCRYQVAGQTLYRNQVAIATDLSANLVTTFEPFRPLADTTTWTFVADDAVMRKDDCTTLRTWGIAAPAAAPVLAAAKGSLTGAYTAVYTFVRFDGAAVAHESNPSATPAALTLASQQLALGDLVHPTDAQVTGYGIYRSLAGGTSHLLDARVTIPAQPTFGVTHTFEVAHAGSLSLHWSIPDSVHSARVTQAWEATATFAGTSEDVNGVRATGRWEITAGHVTTQTLRWAYPSSKVDSALGSSAVETDNDPPPKASWVVEHQEHLFLCRDAVNPHYLSWAKRFKPESWPTSQFVEIGTPDDPLQGAVSLAGLLGVFSRLTKYRILGNATSGFVAQEAISHRGTPAPGTILGTERGVIFLARDGLWLTNFVSPDEELSGTIEALFIEAPTTTINGFSPINWDAIATASAAAYKGRLYVALPTGAATTPNILWVYSPTTRHWYAFDLPVRSLFVEEDTDQLTAGFTDGIVYVLEDADAVGDGGAAVAFEVEKDGHEGQPLVRKLFTHAKVDVDTQGEAVTVQLSVDGVLKRTASLTSSRSKPLLPFPEGSMGYHWRIRVSYTGTKRIAVYGLGVVAEPLRAA